MMNLRPDEKITHEIIEEVFDYEKPYYFKNYEEPEANVIRGRIGP